MTGRDRIALVVVLAAAAVAGLWFTVLAPRREEVRTMQTEVTAQRARLAQAQLGAAQAAQAKATVRRDLAALARLGRAMPVDDDVATLVVQLETAARASHVRLKVFKRTVAATAAPAAGATTPSAAPLPPGVTAATDGQPTMNLSLDVRGRFFAVQRFMARVHRFVRLDGDAVRVRGRLISVDGLSLEALDGDLEHMQAKVTATAYVESAATAAAATATATAGVVGQGAAAGDSDSDSSTQAAASAGGIG